MFKKFLICAILSIVYLAGLATPAQARSLGSRGPGHINGHPCGGDLPPCYVLWRESRGMNVKNRHSSASGYWQVVNGTWNHFHGYRTAMSAPPNVQDDFAKGLWNHGKGCRHWAACR